MGFALGVDCRIIEHPATKHAPYPMTERDDDFGLVATTGHLPRLRLHRAAVFDSHCGMAPGLRSLARGRRARASGDEDSARAYAEAGISDPRHQNESYLQIHGRAGERQLPRVDLGLTHNLGGHPHQNLCAISIVGCHDA